MRIETEIASIAFFPEISPPPPLDTNVPQRVRRLCAQRNPEQLCGMSGKVTLQPQSAKRAFFLGITGDHWGPGTSVRAMSVTTFPSWGVLQEPGGTHL